MMIRLSEFTRSAVRRRWLKRRRQTFEEAYWDDDDLKAYRKEFERGYGYGIEQGMIRRTREAVNEALELRLGSVPEVIQDAVSQLVDKGELDNLFRKAVTATTLEEFQRELSLNRPLLTLPGSAPANHEDP